MQKTSIRSNWSFSGTRGLSCLCHATVNAELGAHTPVHQFKAAVFDHESSMTNGDKRIAVVSITVNLTR